MPHSEKIRQYQARAEELRTIAQDFTHRKPQEMLLKLATDYERMAEELKRDLPKQPGPKL